MGRFRPGSGFTDQQSGLALRGLDPAEHPELWRAYLEGARKRYREHGVEHALDLARIADGHSTSLFWVALDGDQVVGGLRCHGPLTAAVQAAALGELAAHPRLDEARQAVEARLPDGLVEIKGVWVDGQHPARDAIGAAMARCYVHSLRWLGARFGLCTSSRHALPRWITAGARPDEHLGPVAYPDERYETYLVWWDLERLAIDASADQLARIGAERAELGDARPRHSAALRPAAGGSGARDADPSVWRPLILDDDDPRLSALRADPAIEVVDRLEEQRAELDELLPACPPELRAEPARWVHYSWRRCVVRTLGPAGLRRLRSDRNRNKITAEEQRRLSELRVGVIGLSVGHVIAHTLALEGLCGHLALADFDRIEVSNLNRIPATLLDVGLNKAVVAARRIAELDPYLEVAVEAEGVTEDNLEGFVAGLDVVIEECDSLDLKLRIREVARRHGVPVLMETSDRGLLDVERFDLDPDRQPFHGLVADLAAEDLVGLTTKDKAPYVLKILEPHELSARMAASMAEIDETVTTWPQLGGDVTLGAATMAAAVRRLGRGDELPSGRIRVDLDAGLDEIAEPAPSELLLEPGDGGDASGEPPDDPLLAMAHAANLAPSGGNVQPWRFGLDDGGLRIRIDPSRSTSMDVALRGTYLAAGAAALNARIAAAAQGRLGPAEVLPDPSDPELAAVVRLGSQIDIDLAALYDAMLERCTNRRHGEPDAAIEPDVLEELRAAAQAEGASARIVSDREEVTACGELLAESDRLRYLSPWLHREMMAELRWPDRDSLEEGLDVRTLELSASDLAKLAVIRRSEVVRHLSNWRAGRALREMMQDTIRASSALVAVTRPASGPADYVEGGAAVERVWIRAQQLGLAVQPVSPVSVYAVEPEEYAQLVPDHQVDELRELTAGLLERMGVPDGDRLMLVLRLSYAPPPTERSRRRPLAKALDLRVPSAQRG